MALAICAALGAVSVTAADKTAKRDESTNRRKCAREVIVLHRPRKSEIESGNKH